jgi:predicted regulator of Ras-like GTPase activity (Roadblock/LC7/MglB family)
MGIEEILGEMKEKGIGGAVVKTDGTIVQSTIALNDLSAGMLSSVCNISDAIMKKSGDRQQEVEVSFGGLILVMVPMNHHIFCGMIKNREDKAQVLEYAAKAKGSV